MKKILCFALTILLLMGCVSCALVEETTTIVTHTSPDSNYTLTLYQVGSPQWSFGSVGAKLVLRQSDGKMIHSESISFDNDGVGVRERNIVNVIWGETSVEVETKHFDTTRRNFYTFPYDSKGEVTCQTTFVEEFY